MNQPIHELTPPAYSIEMYRPPQFIEFTSIYGNPIAIRSDHIAVVEYPAKLSDAQPDDAQPDIGTIIATTTRCKIYLKDTYAEVMQKIDEALRTPALSPPPTPDSDKPLSPQQKAKPCK